MAKNKAVIIFGGARRNGNTGKLIDRIAGKLSAPVIDVSEKNISPYDYEHNNSNDDFISVINDLLSYEQYIFATPIYWYGPSAQMKTFIDRTSDLLDIDALKTTRRMLRNKTAYIACTSISNNADSAFLSSMQNTFEYLGMQYSGYIHANCDGGYIDHKHTQAIDDFSQLVISTTLNKY